MFQMHHDYEAKDNATFEQRAVALVLDLTIIGLLKGLLPIPALLGSLLSLIYFVFLQCQFGFTPGKYFAGLRVISTTGQTSLPRMLLRESIGKFVSSLVFLLGYLVVMFSKNRLAWHDKMSRTRVISLKPQDVSGFAQFARGATSLIALLIVGVVGFTSYILYSSAGAQAVANLFEKNSFVVRGVSGSLANGVKIESLQKQTKLYKIDLKNLFLQVNHNKSVFNKIIEIKSNPVINKIHITGGTVEIFKDINPEKEGLALIPKDLLPRRKNAPEKLQLEDLDQKKAQRRQTGTIESVEIANINLKLGEYDLNLDRFSVGNLVLDKHSLTAGHLYLKGSLGTFMIKNFTQLDKSQRSSYSYDFTIIPNSFFPKKLKKPFRFLGNFSKMKDSLTFDLKSSDEKLVLSKNESHFRLKLNRFPFDQYFKGNLPIKSMSLDTSGKYISGKLKIRNQTYHFDKQPLFGVRGSPIIGRSIRNKRVGVSWLNLLIAKPWLLVERRIIPQKAMRSLASTQERSIFQPISKNDLSNMYVNKPYIALKPKAKHFIDNDIEFFSNSFIPNKEP